MTTTTPPTTPQGVNHPTFNPPDPLLHGLSVPGLYEYHAKHSPDHPVFTYADPASGKPHDITFAEVWNNIRAVMNIIRHRCPTSPDGASPSVGICGRPVVGILAVSDALSYIYTIVALLGLGYTAFPLSTTSNPDATASLLETNQVRHLFVSADAGMQTLAQGAMGILGEKNIIVETMSMVVPEDYDVQDKQLAEDPNDFVRKADDRIALILHSGGSTGLPKAIPISGRALVNAANGPCFGDVDWAGKRIGAHTNPLFHATGSLITMIFPLSCGAVFAVYPPVRPLTVPTPASYLAGWQACQCDAIFCVPVFIEALARSAAGVAALKALEHVIFIGAPLSKSIGDMLVSEGVRIVSAWGSTEVGILTKVLPSDGGMRTAKDWEYVEMSPRVRLHMERQEGFPENVFEYIVMSNELSFPHVSNMVLDGKPAWAMGDLLERHPTHSALWKILGRKGDQIVFSTSRVLNPVPIEKLLVELPTVRAAVVFGQGHIDPGILVEPSELGQTVERVKESIWPTMESVNAQLDKHARFRPNMLLLASPEKPFERSIKGEVRRAACLRLYADEIEALYSQVESEPLESRAFKERM
ncbi:acetyl-CoA synthetase-like protein [Trametes polyzona]|nr:acetyl-CoA synthetase-like protein [Trametes polyzona]